LVSTFRPGRLRSSAPSVLPRHRCVFAVLLSHFPSFVRQHHSTCVPLPQLPKRRNEFRTLLPSKRSVTFSYVRYCMSAGKVASRSPTLLPRHAVHPCWHESGPTVRHQLHHSLTTYLRLMNADRFRTLRSRNDPETLASLKSSGEKPITKEQVRRATVNGVYILGHLRSLRLNC